MRRKVVIGMLCLSFMLGTAACAKTTDMDNAAMPEAPLHPVEEETEGEFLSVETSAGSEIVAASTPCPVNMAPRTENNYPYMGVSLTLPDSLLNAILENTVFMAPNEDAEYTDLEDADEIPADWKPNASHTLLHSGYIEFLYLPEGMREKVPYVGMENPMSYDEFIAWIAKALPMGRIEMYRKEEFQEEQLEKNGFAAYEKLGENTELRLLFKYKRGS